MAYIGCIAGALLIDDCRRQLASAGFADVVVIDAGADLNAYTKVEGQSGRLTYADNQPGTWKLTEEALILAWKKGRIDTYDGREGDQMSGDSTIGHKVAVRKASNP